MLRRTTRAVVVAVIFWGATQASASELRLGRVTATPGTSVTVPITYRQGRGAVAVALGSDVTFDPRVLSKPRCAAGSALIASGPGAKLVTCGEPQPGLVRIAVLGLNTTPLPTGEIATVTFDVAATAPRRLYILRHKSGAADANGADFRLTHRSGVIRTR
jgi:hypothetical protein